MNGYDLSIIGSNYVILTQVTAADEDQALEQALYTLINSEPSLDLFDKDLKYEAELVEVMEEN